MPSARSYVIRASFLSPTLSLSLGAPPPPSSCSVGSSPAVSNLGHVFVFRSRRSSQVPQRYRRCWKNKIARKEEAACVRRSWGTEGGGYFRAPKTLGAVISAPGDVFREDEKTAVRLSRAPERSTHTHTHQLLSGSQTRKTSLGSCPVPGALARF